MVTYRRHFLRMLPPEAQLPLLIEAMHPGDVLGLNGLPHTSSAALRLFWRAVASPPPLFAHAGLNRR